MSRLLKADIYRMMKSRLTMIALILAFAFPFVMVLLYIGIRTMAGLGEDLAGSEMLFNANSVIGSAYSLTNNIGLIIPAFAGILACSDYSDGTLRNKVIAGNRRSAIYLSHLAVSILFTVGIITIYVAMTAALSLLFLPFNRDPSMQLGREIIYFVAYGTMTFVFIATVSTLLAMTLRNIAPTIIFTIVLVILLLTANSVLLLTDYSAYKYLVYFIPTFGANFFNLDGSGLLELMSATAGHSETLIFTEGMLSYAFFGIVNTVIGLIVFNKRDIK